jgi:hypothetical protein
MLAAEPETRNQTDGDLCGYTRVDRITQHRERLLPEGTVLAIMASATALSAGTRPTPWARASLELKDESRHGPLLEPDDHGRLPAGPGHLER